MPDLLFESRSLLEAAGYRTALPEPDSTHLHFEDANILGVLHILPSAELLLSTWRNLQDEFLRKNASHLLADPIKAWNCYCIFLTSMPCPLGGLSTLFAIEDDFRGTRKIVRSSISTRRDVDNALAPLLPIRHLLTFAAENSKMRLASRLAQLQAPLKGLLTDATTHDIARGLLGAE